MLVKKNVRLPQALIQEIEQMAAQQSVNFSEILREIITLGLRVKKHMESNQSEEKKAAMVDSPHLELGASSAIETLYLLRKVASHFDAKWIEEAHQQALAKIDNLDEA